MPPRSCSGRHRRCCSAWGSPGPVLPPGAPMRRLCADLLHALFSREESPGGLLRWGRMARPWSGIKAGRGAYLSDGGLNFFSDAGALYPHAACLHR